VKNSPASEEGVLADSLSRHPAPECGLLAVCAKLLGVRWRAWRNFTPARKNVWRPHSRFTQPSARSAGCWRLPGVTTCTARIRCLRYPCHTWTRLDLIHRKVAHTSFIAMRPGADLANLAAIGHRCALLLPVARTSATGRVAGPQPEVVIIERPRTTAPIRAIAALARLRNVQLAEPPDPLPARRTVDCGISFTGSDPSR